MTGIVICHKTLAKELVQTVHSILGYSDDLIPFSNDKLTTEDGVRRIHSLLEGGNKTGGVVFMTDMRGGNCWTMAQMASRGRENYYVLSGVNLPMILSFLTKKNQLNPRELAETMETDAHRGLVLEK